MPTFALWYVVVALLAGSLVGFFTAALMASGDSRGYRQGYADGSRDTAKVALKATVRK